MAEANLQIGNRPYKVQVAEGQEGRLQMVATELDSIVGKIREAAGNNIDRDRLLVLSALTLADQLHDMRARQETEKHTLVSFHANLAERLEAVSRKISSS